MAEYNSIWTGTQIDEGIGYAHALSGVGSIISTSSNINPSGKYGGTWVLLRKTCINKTIASFDTTGTYFNRNTSNTTANQYTGVWLSIVDNVLSIRALITPSVALGTSTVELGTFNWANIGLTSGIVTAKYVSLRHENLSAIAICQLFPTGVLSSQEVITNTVGGTIPAGSIIVMNEEFKIPHTHISDSICDEWVWKRTA